MMEHTDKYQDQNIQHNSAEYLDDKDYELVSKLRQQIWINKMQINRIEGVIRIEKIHAIFGLVAAIFLTFLIIFSVFSAFYGHITNVDMPPEVLVAIVLPILLSMIFAAISLFTSTMSRIHELQYVEAVNRVALKEADVALHGV